MVVGLQVHKSAHQDHERHSVSSRAEEHASLINSLVGGPGLGQAALGTGVTDEARPCVRICGPLRFPETHTQRPQNNPAKRQGPAHSAEGETLPNSLATQSPT